MDTDILQQKKFLGYKWMTAWVAARYQSSFASS